MKIQIKSTPIWHAYLSPFNIKTDAMNLKRIFGAILTILGIAGLIYAAVVFTNTGGNMRDVKTLLVYGVLGLIFFISGIGLVKTTKDVS